MLAADREVLAAYRVRETADLLEKEIGYLQTELGTIATQAALLAGFIFGALTMQGSTVSGNPYFAGGGSTYQNNPGVSQGFWNEKMMFGDNTKYQMDFNLCLSEVIFTLVLGGSLVSNLLCVFSATFIMMWGPRRALMAQERDMEDILIRIRLERRKSLKHFLTGVFTFLLSAVVHGWMYWQGPSAITITVVCGYGAWELHAMESSMRHYFKAPPIFNNRFFGGGPTATPFEEPLLGDLMSQDQIRKDLSANT